VYTPVFTPGVLPSALRGQLKLFKIAPGDFVRGSRLILAALMTFCINLLQFFERSTPDQTRPRVKKAERNQSAGKEKRTLVCKACGHDITSDGERISINGQHVHTRMNPAGFEYTFDCFREAPGCRQVGTPSYEHTWFAGYCWQIAVCAGCGEQLGWLFRNQDGFYGLIKDRLAEK
jgi:hypothetical protein